MYLACKELSISWLPGKLVATKNRAKTNYIKKHNIDEGVSMVCSEVHKWTKMGFDLNFSAKKKQSFAI